MSSSPRRIQKPTHPQSVQGKSLNRRTLLRGSGVAIALPMLHAMRQASAARTTSAQVKRLGYYYIPMGYYPDAWTPKEEGRLGTLKSSLEPLESVKDQLTVMTNLDLQNAYPGSHATSNSAFLSAARAKLTESTDYELGTTVDQIAAQKIGLDSARASLELAMDSAYTVGQCDNGYACVYQNSLSWSSPTTPLPAESHPRLVFEMLFGEGGTLAERQR
ncbi:MAG: DUF1552 domain-containing protein, partial [Planctomycetota bacterium]